MKKLTFLLICTIIIANNLVAQSGFTSITDLTPIPVSTSTGEKPQAKVWSYSGKHWAVLPNSSGTHLWRLDGTTWTSVLKLSSRTSTKADCKIVGSTAHILLYQGTQSQLVSVEYNHASGSYLLWAKRLSTVDLILTSRSETATLDIDGTGRMWMVYDGDSEIYAKWSDDPYTTWSEPITMVSGVTNDDIGAVIAMQGKIGVFWSNQNTKRFGFRTHLDGADPTVWAADEVPASQSAIDTGNGMSDDNLNMCLGSEGTMYCAVKTSHDGGRHPESALLVQHPTRN